MTENNEKKQNENVNEQGSASENEQPKAPSAPVGRPKRRPDLTEQGKKEPENKPSAEDKKASDASRKELSEQKSEMPPKRQARPPRKKEEPTAASAEPENKAAPASAPEQKTESKAEGKVDGKVEGNSEGKTDGKTESNADGKKKPRDKKKEGRHKKKKKTGEDAHSLRRTVSGMHLVIDTQEQEPEEDEASAVAAEAQELYDDMEEGPVEVLSSRINRTGTTPTLITGVIKSVVYLVSVLIVSIALALTVIIVGNDMFALIKEDVSVTVTIPDEISIDELTDLLSENKIINCPFAFRIYAKVKGVDTSRFVGGEYTVSSLMNYEMLCSLFIPVKEREIIRITIPEGASVRDIIKIFTDAGIGTERGFVDAINNYDYAQYFDFVRVIDENKREGRIFRLEGYLYPDTYDFYSDAKESQVIYKLLENFDVKFSKQMRADARNAGYTIEDIVILASMVQKEAYLTDDYDMTASVFINRLNAPETYPKLESDATTAYAIEMATGKRPETIGEEEIAFESPYNTRISEGLPPSAICNPGYDAIMCTIYPAASEMYYFVADSTGKNIYSATYEEHLENVEKVKAESAGGEE